MVKEMKKNLLLAGAILALVNTTANAEIVNFTAIIDGAQADECAGTGSGSTGTGTFTLDTATNEVTFSIQYSALDGAENNAHVHVNAPCINGPMVYGLPAGSPKNGMQTLSAGEAQDMLDGLHYVNIHSTLHGGGEIRGQILQEPGVPTVSEWGLVAMVLLMLAAGAVIFRRVRMNVVPA